MKDDASRRFEKELLQRDRQMENAIDLQIEKIEKVHFKRGSLKQRGFHNTCSYKNEIIIFKSR
jgi:hypothetical protein